jgi:hypothetical protein
MARRQFHQCGIRAEFRAPPITDNQHRPSHRDLARPPFASGLCYCINAEPDFKSIA